MSSQLVGALKAATVRMMERRAELRRAQVLLRVYPEGLVFSCNFAARNNEELKASGRRVVPWEEMLAMTPADAIKIVDEVCHDAAVYLGAA